MAVTIPQGHLNIAREHMPQIRRDLMPLFLDDLKKHGINHSLKNVTVGLYKPSQAEISHKVMSKIGKLRNDRPIVVSNDGYVLDGHHRWQVAYNQSKTMRIPAVVVDLPILELIAQAKRWSGVTYRGIHENTALKNIKKIAVESHKKLNI